MRTSRKEGFYSLPEMGGLSEGRWRGAGRPKSAADYSFRGWLGAEFPQVRSSARVRLSHGVRVIVV
jgi:hypothetical protein